MTNMVYILQVQPSSGSYKTVNVITQEDFEKMAPRAPRKVNPEVPPPPPPSLSTAPEFPATQKLDEDTLLENVSQVIKLTVPKNSLFVSSKSHQYQSLLLQSLSPKSKLYYAFLLAAK